MKSGRAVPAPLPTPEPASQAPLHADTPKLKTRTKAQPLDQRDVNVLFDEAARNDHDAQYELAKRHAQGSKGASRSAQQRDYWLARAAAGQHEKAVDAVLRAAGAHRSGKSILLLDAQACSDHAAVKVGKARVATEIFEKCIHVTGLDGFNKAELIEHLFAVPENRPWLEMAACLMKNGQLTDIRISEYGEHDSNMGDFTAAFGNITVRTPRDGDMSIVADTLMHELGHAVMFALHANGVKSYSSASGKRDLEQALKDSRAGEIRALTPRERAIADYMNKPYTQPEYNHRRSYKIEREVRIGALLAADYACKSVFEKDYPKEYARYLRQGKLCAEYVDRCARQGTGIDPTPDSSRKPHTRADERPTARHLAGAVFDRAVGAVFKDIRQRFPGTAYLQACANLEDALIETEKSIKSFTLDQLSQLCDELAQSYVPCCSGTPAQRRYDFSHWDEPAVRGEVERVVQEISTRKPAPLAIPETGSASPQFVSRILDLEDTSS